MDILKDTNGVLSTFTKIMIETSIEKALYYNGSSDVGGQTRLSREKRPSDRLDFRYIDSFIKLIIVLLKTFDFNKQEFMQKVFESVIDTLCKDHNLNKIEFN